MFKRSEYLGDAIAAIGSDMTQSLEIPLTLAADAGDTALATVTTEGITVLSASVTELAVAGNPDMDTLEITDGSGERTFLDDTAMQAANFTAAQDQQSNRGAWYMPAGQTINANAVDIAGSTAHNKMLVIRYEASEDGGTLVLI